jgi:hypothetical protein
LRIYNELWADVETALEKASVEFVAENGGGPGVKLIKSAQGAEEISRQIDALEDKISSIPAPTEPSPEAGMNIMRKAVAKNDLAKLKNRRKRVRTDPFQISGRARSFAKRPVRLPAPLASRSRLSACRYQTEERRLVRRATATVKAPVGRLGWRTACR